MDTITAPVSPRQLQRRLGAAKFYASEARYSFHSCGALTARQCAVVLARHWDILSGPSGPQRETKFVVPWLLDADAVAKVPFLRDVQLHLPATLRLFCAVWPNGTVAMTALPTLGPNPSVWWCGFAHDAAQDLPTLVQLTGDREVGPSRKQKTGGPDARR